VYAFVEGPDGKYRYSGIMNVLTRTLKTYTAKLVDLDGSYHLETLATDLNAIYRPYGITWNLTDDIAFKNDTDSKTIIEAAKAIDYASRDALFSEYKPGQLALNARYKARLHEICSGCCGFANRGLQAWDL
jgi:hypothetical protein